MAKRVSNIYEMPEMIQTVSPPFYHTIQQLLSRAVDQDTVDNGCRYQSDELDGIDEDDFPTHQMDQFEMADFIREHKDQSFFQNPPNPKAPEPSEPPQAEPEPEPVEPNEPLQ